MSKQDPFHAHLDLCRRCREQPFNLCPVGALLLRSSLDHTELAFVETLRRSSQARKVTDG